MRILHKYSGAGNDFLIVDDFEKGFPLEQIPFLCRKDTGFGVDGCILWRRSQVADGQMLYFNADGSKAAMCGNGLRCLIQYLRDQGKEKKEYTIEVWGKVLTGKCKGSKIWTFFPEAKTLFWSLQLGNRELFVVDTTVPHAVLFAEDPLDVVQEGMAIRSAPLFAPDGVNVNFVSIESKDKLRLRTYERGVEAETLACGTGAAAAVFVAHALGKTSKRVKVETRSKMCLDVELNNGIQVSGPAEKIGEYQLKL